MKKITLIGLTSSVILFFLPFILLFAVKVDTSDAHRSTWLVTAAVGSAITSFCFFISILKGRGQLIMFGISWALLLVSAILTMVVYI